MKIYNAYMLHVKLKNNVELIKLNFINLNLPLSYYALKTSKVIFVKCVLSFRLVYPN